MKKHLTLAQKIEIHERAISRHKEKLDDLYRKERAISERQERFSAIAQLIDKAEDAVANAADREFGAENWRRNRATRRRVIARMKKATHKLRIKLDAILSE